MIRSILLLFSITFFTITLSLSAQVNPNIKSIEINEKLTLGKSDIHYFGTPKDIAVSSEGDIFVADEDRMGIMVFDENGNFKRSIGRRGRGPGEFLTLGEIYLNKKSELLVVNKMGFEIAKFDTNGNVLDTFLLSKKTQDIVFFKEMVQLSNGNYLILYKRFGFPNVEDEKFHIWDQEFTDPVLNFGSFTNLSFENDYAKLIMQFGMGTIAMVNENELLYAPNVYTGNIYHYHKQGTQWASAEEFNGMEMPHSSSKVYTDTNNIPMGGFTIHGPHGEISGEIFALSGGIFVLNDGKIVHFSMIKHPDSENSKWDMGVELFDTDFNYIGYFALKSFQELHSDVIPAIRTKDVNDNFYMITREQGIPLIRKFTLDIREN